LRSGAALAVVLLALTACGGDQPPAAVPTGAGKPLAAVGISVASLSSPYYAAIAQGAAAAARGINPAAQVTISGDEYSAFTQAEQIDGFIAAHVDMILLTPADPKLIAEAVGRAHAAGIVVVGIDAPAEGTDAQVATDNAAAGALACGALAQALGGHGQVAILGGPPTQTMDARDQGCADALGQLPDIRVTSAPAGPDGPPDGTREAGRRTMRGLLAGEGPIDAVFAATDAEALGAADVIAELGRPTLVASAEGSPAIEAALASRARPNIVASAAIDPYAMGGNAARVANDIREGHTPDPGQLLLAPQLVTRDTVRDYKGWLAARE
jgi:ribose transport system substrate-binding protein